MSVTTYSYDSNSNRISMDKDGDVTVYEYNELNQLVSAGGIVYTWDNAGNLVSQSNNGTIVASYTYDCHNRMLTASVNTSSGTIEQSYTYDYLGNRTSKTTDGVTVEYTTDLSSGYSQILKETTGSDVIYYTRGFELISRRAGDDAAYYIYDGGMSVRALSDEAGTITDTYVFDAFGNETARTGDSENSYGFQGEQKDETGLYYLRARYMDPSTGSFTTMDTYAGRLSDPMSLHKYMFANANPVKYCDPSGHFTLCETLLATALMSEIAASTLYLVTVYTTDKIQYNSLGEAVAGALITVVLAMLIGVLFVLLYFILALIVSVAFAAVVFALFGIGMSTLGILNGVLDVKDGNKILGWTEIVISVVFLILSLKALCDYTPISDNCSETQMPPSEMHTDPLANNSNSENGYLAAQRVSEGGRPCIGKMRDLTAENAMQDGEFAIADYLPDRGDPRLNWDQNSTVLRCVMDMNQPIRDVSPYPMENAGFLGVERLTLLNHGWTYVDGVWYPPI